MLLLIGAASILAGVLYTGGPRPYGYEGLGEVFVFLFFGVVAVTGSYYVQPRTLPGRRSCWRSRSACWPRAILVVNNVRDLETDRRAGKRTLAVRLGRERTRTLYAAMVYGAFVTRRCRGCSGALTAWLLLPLLRCRWRVRARPRPCARARRRPDAQRARWRGPGAAAAGVLRPALGRAAAS